MTSTQTADTHALNKHGLTTSAQNALNAAKVKRSPMERARDNPKSVKLAVAAFCYHTCKEQTANNSHTTKRAIKNCEKTECPLWPHRGSQKLGK